MQAALVIFLLTHQPVDIVLDCVERQHATLASAQIQATSLTDVGSKVFRSQYVLTYERGRLAEVRYDEPQSSLPKRTLLVEPGRIILAVADLNQYTVRSRTGGLVDDINSSDTLDPVLAMHLEPSGVRDWLEPMRKLKGWSLSQGQNRLVASYSNQGSRAVINIDPANVRIQSFRLETGERSTEWTFTYRQKPAQVAYRPGPLDLRVDQIDTSLKLPTFQDSESRNAIVKAIQFYSRIREIAYTATTEGVSVDVSIKNRTFRQESEHSVISYNGSTLVALDRRTRKAFTGEAKMSEVTMAAAKVGSRIEPTLYNVASGRNPIRVILASAESVKSVGTANIDGEVCDLLSARGPGIEIMLTIERSTGKLRATTSQVVRSSGPIAPTTVIYKYSQPPANESALFAQVPSDYERLPVLAATAN